jgi:sulfotransferase family protein
MTEPARRSYTPAMPTGSRFDRLAASAILIVGAPRSGTSWLGKIFDSHPDTIYRFEPDWFDPDDVVASQDRIRENMTRWIANRDPRSAGKRPFFPKSWQSAPARHVRACLIYAEAAATRIGLPAWPVPDLGVMSRARAVVKSVRLRKAIGAFAGACPDGRAVLILRHPCGQIASLMRGTRDGRFDLAEPGTDMPFDEAGAIAFAARLGVEPAAFQRLSDAAKYAWSWRAFNETALASIAERRNARTIVYEDLCAKPADQARSLLAFAGLSWHRRTETFLAQSTHYNGPAGYYAVLRNSIAAADRWRATMTPQDQADVRSVVSQSPLIECWPDLTG